MPADAPQHPRMIASQRERFLEALFASATDYAIIALDLDGLVIAWNPGAEHVLGWTEEEMLGKPASNFFTIEDRRAGVPQAEMKAALEKGRGSDERWHQKKDGACFWANGEMMPLTDEAGTVQGFVKILRDRTEQRLATEAQRTDAEFLRSVLTSSGDCIKVLDLEGRLLFMNDGGQRIMGITEFATLKGTFWQDFWPEHGRPMVHAAVAAAREGGTRQFQEAARTFTGIEKFWDVRVLPMLDPHGQPATLLAVSRDISEQHSTNRALRELNETLEQRVRAATQERDRIWHVSRDLLGVADGDGVWRSINPAWSHTLGWGYHDIVGRTLDWLLHPDDIVGTQECLRRHWAGEAKLPFENRIRTNRGDYRTISWTAVQVEGLLYCVLRDITEQRAKEAALDRAEEALRQSQKMEALGQLTGGIAHDFNNLLTGIIGSLDIVRRRIATGELNELPRFMDAASTSAQRAAALTHRLLAFSRRQSLDTRPSDVNRLVAGMEELLRRTLGEQVALQTSLNETLWPALADDNQLENAILNLAINARDAMPNGGRLTIETGNTVLDAAYAAANAEVLAGDYVAISVTDTGTGMTPDVVEKAFDPFFTTKPVGEGTGLGLSMIYGFVKQSGGHVRIYSEPGQGTTIRLYLPRALADLAEPKPPAVETPRGQGETVLVVEDEASVRMIVTEVLNELGYQHLEASDGREAVQILRSGARIDLLITDVGLPNMNGRELAEIAREARPELKVLFVTGYAEKAAVRHGLLDPGMAMLTKPFALDALGTKIRAMIEES